MTQEGYEPGFAPLDRAASARLARERYGLPEGYLLSVGTLEPGKNRIGFGIFDRARKQIITNKAALYVAPVGGGEVSGPFPARYESLEVKPQFQSEGVKADPDAATALYVAEVRFPKPGAYEVLGAVEFDDNLAAATSSVGALRVVKDTAVRC